MIRSSERGVLALVLILIAACTEEQGNLKPDLDGMPARASGQLADTLRSSRGLAFIPKTVVDGRAQQLSFIGWAGTTDSILALSQEQDSQIRIYSHDGILLASVGARGAGPAEFEAIRYLGWLADTIWAWDSRLKRLSFIDPHRARVLRTVNLPRFRPIRAFGSDAKERVSESARALAVYPDEILVAGAGLNGESNSPGIPLYSSTLDGKLLRLIGRFPKSTSRVPYAGRQMSGSVLIPFSPDPLVSVAPDGDRIAAIELKDTGTDFKLTIFNRFSDTIVSRVYPASAERIPDELRDNARKSAISRAIQRGAATEAISALKTMQIPRVYPAVRELLLGRNNTTWIRLRDDPPSRARWMVLDGSGEIVDTLYLPSTARVMEAGRNHVLLRTVDGFDVPSIALYELRKN